MPRSKGSGIFDDSGCLQYRCHKKGELLGSFAGFDLVYCTDHEYIFVDLLHEMEKIHRRNTHDIHKRKQKPVKKPEIPQTMSRKFMEELLKQK